LNEAREPPSRLKEGSIAMIRNTKVTRPPSHVLFPEELEALREKLIAERERIAEDYERDLASAQAIQEEAGEDPEELAEIGVEREQLYGYSEQDYETLQLVAEALQRMDEGTYGRCLETGEPIPLERLWAIPWARYRADVQERIENAEIAKRAAYAESF
jgi:RNA polymerase-binding transcription factor